MHTHLLTDKHLDILHTHAYTHSPTHTHTHSGTHALTLLSSYVRYKLPCYTVLLCLHWLLILSHFLPLALNLHSQVLSYTHTAAHFWVEAFLRNSLVPSVMILFRCCAKINCTGFSCLKCEAVKVYLVLWFCSCVVPVLTALVFPVWNVKLWKWN